MAKHVLVLIGTGAQLNSWEPVLRALRRVGWADVQTAEEANDILTHVVQVRRYFALSKQYLHERSGAAHLPSSAGLAEAERVYSLVCSAVREELALAEVPTHPNGVKLRPEFAAVWNVVVGQAEQVAAMTTNWDRTTSVRISRHWPDGGDDIVLHLHGDRRDAAGFLLPSEITFEPYRTEEELRLLSRRRMAILTAFEKADRLAIYGLSFGPLDAELVHVVTHGLELGSIKEIEIVDPEHQRVARRLMTLIPSRRPKVTGRSPADLQTAIDYPWPRKAFSK